MSFCHCVCRPDVRIKLKILDSQKYIVFDPVVNRRLKESGIKPEVCSSFTNLHHVLCWHCVAQMVI